MNDEAWAEFRSDVKRQLDESFSRIRKLETAQVICQEKDKQLLEKMDALMDFFKSHDEHEMKKYEQIDGRISKLQRLAAYVTGGLTVLSFIGFDNIRQAMFG